MQESGFRGYVREQLGLFFSRDLQSGWGRMSQRSPAYSSQMEDFLRHAQAYRLVDDFLARYKDAAEEIGLHCRDGDLMYFAAEQERDPLEKSSLSEALITHLALGWPSERQLVNFLSVLEFDHRWSSVQLSVRVPVNGSTRMRMVSINDLRAHLARLQGGTLDRFGINMDPLGRLYELRASIVASQQLGAPCGAAASFLEFKAHPLHDVPAQLCHRFPLYVDAALCTLTPQDHRRLFDWTLNQLAENVEYAIHRQHGARELLRLVSVGTNSSISIMRDMFTLPTGPRTIRVRIRRPLGIGPGI